MMARVIGAASVFAIAAACAEHALAQSQYNVLHAFPNPGGIRQSAALVLAADGDFYGTTYAGGSAGLGTIFKVTAGGALTILHSFTGGTDGASPYAALMQAADGNFYGTTLRGGTSDFGTIFRMTPAGTVTILHQFAGGQDGAHPYSPLIQTPDGTFYGTTPYGGGFSRGTIFTMTPAGVVAIHVAIKGPVYETRPFAGLLHATDGSFYGVSTFGGLFGNRGSLFRMAATGGGIADLHNFSGAADGEFPYAEVIQGTDGNLYGTTSAGGAFGKGVVFKSSRDSPGIFTLLHEFTGGADGGHPSGPLLQGPDGSFYGTAAAGGASSFGVVYRVSPAGLFTPIHAFDGADGSCPCSAVVRGADGSFYGTTYSGGAVNAGVIFRVTSDGAFTLVQSLPGGPEAAPPRPAVFQGLANPKASVILGTDGALYGTTSAGGTADLGAVIKIDRSGAVTPLYSFTGKGDGGQPTTALVQAADGNFYGGTGFGQQPSVGTNVLFKITPGGTFTRLHILDLMSEGQIPSALIQATDGDLYGTTRFGGHAGLGTVFRMTTSGDFTTLHVFTGGADGAGSVAALVEATDGNFYGTTAEGGVWGLGTVFKMTPAGGVTILHAFAGGSDGSFPNAAVIQGRDGNLYGTTTLGGTHGSGTVFKLSTTGSAFTILHSFNYTDGGYPYAPLLQLPDGTFSGTTTYGGPSQVGTIFRMTSTGALTVVHRFSGMNGGRPFGGLVRAPDGKYFGATFDGGPAGMGVVFQIDALGMPMPLFWRNKSTGQTLTWRMNGTSIAEVGAPPVIADTNWEVKAHGDFDGDGNRDVIWRHTITGANIAWLMARTLRAAGVLPAMADTNWEIQGVGDVNADGRSDVIWRHTVTGQNLGWLMNGLAVSSSAFLPTVVDTNWEIKGIGDFNRDAHADVVWRHTVAGQNIVWFMNDLTIASFAFLPAITDTTWEIAGVGDLDANGNADVIWRNRVTGHNIAWLMNGAIVASAAFLPTVVDVQWEIQVVGDLDASGSADIFWRHRATGQNVVWLMNGLTVGDFAFLPTIADASWEVVGR